MVSQWDPALGGLPCIYVWPHDHARQIQPVGVGETWQSLFDKIVLKITGPESTIACQYDQLCAVIKAGINGAIHGVQAIWDKILTTENGGLLLVDAKDVFNEINRVIMLWTVIYFGHREIVFL